MSNEVASGHSNVCGLCNYHTDLEQEPWTPNRR